MNLPLRALEKFFAKKLDIIRIEKYIDSLDKISNLNNKGGHVSLAENRVNCGEGAIVATVQRKIKLVSKVEKYIDLLHHFILEAAKANSDLVVFPEYNFFDLFGLIPGFIKLDGYLNRKAQVNRVSTSNGSSRPFLFLLKAIAEPSAKAISQIFTLFAKKYQIYIYTGSYMLKDKGQLYNVGALISREGKIIGIQKKLHLTSFEDNLGLVACDNLEIYNLDIGKVACPICMDATYFETFAIARNLGADIVILPIANNEEYHPSKALRGIWPRVQESYVFGIKAALNGWFAGTHFTGKAGIFAPLEMTEKRNGIISISQSSEDNALLIGALDLIKLHRVREESEYHGDRNLDFEAEYFIKTYLPMLSRPEDNKSFTN